MNNPKNMLLIALIFLGFLLYMEWQQDYAPKPVVENTTTQSNQTNLSSDGIDNIDTPVSTLSNTDDVPTVATEKMHQQPKVEVKARASGSIITVTSNVLKLKIDTLGGSIVYSELLKFPVTKKVQRKHYSP